MKTFRSMILTSILGATALLSGCNNDYLNSTPVSNAMNSVLVLGMPIKVNDVFTITHMTKMSGYVTLDVDIAPSARGTLNPHLNKSLKGKLAQSGLCFIPELKSPSTTVVINIYQKGILKGTTKRPPSFLCN